MIYDKKPSVYTDRGTIGSAEELDAYGVWVKSEPQDMVAGLAGTVDYENDAMSYEPEYDAGFSIPESEPADADIADFNDSSLSESEFTGSSFDSGDSASSSFINSSFDDGSGSTGEVSTQLLMKIADELSSIRTELTTLKREFADIRAETGTVAKDTARHSDFFEEDEDEKITLTGDELNNILSSANLTSEEEVSFDSLRDEDEAALSEISDQNDASTQLATDIAASGDEEEAEDELIDIDYDNLGIDLNYTEEPETSEQELQAEDSVSLDDISEQPGFDEIPTQGEEEPLFSVSEMEEITELSEETAVNELSEDLAVVETEDADELRSLRLEGAAPLTPPPDESDYLEADPFPMNDSGLDDLSSSENSLELNLNETGFDLALDDFADEPGVLQEETIEEEEQPLEELSLEETETSSEDEVSFKESSLDEFSMEETTLDEASMDEISSQTMAFEETPLEDDTGLSDAGLSLEETPLDEISFDDTSMESFSLEETPFEESSQIEESSQTLTLEEEPVTEVSDTSSLVEETSLDDEISLVDEPTLDEETSLVDASSLDDELVIDEEVSFDETSLETFSLEEMALEEPLEEAPIDLSEAIIDEPDLSAGIAEAPLEEPSLSDISLEMDDFDLSSDFDVKDDEVIEELAVADTETEAGMNITSETDESLNGELTTNGLDAKSIDFALDDFGEGFDPGTKDEDSGLVAYSDEKDDSIAQVIPEGFEVDAEEAAITLDDDLEAFSDDLPAADEGVKQELSAEPDEAPAGVDVNIPIGLKTELKNVLSYMDHLLESLPEEKIEEFAKSEYFDAYKKLFKDLGLA